MNLNTTASPPLSAASPRRRFVVLLSFVAVHLLTFTAHAQSVTTAIPGYISYQGTVLDASGNPLGTGTPVSRLAIFRIWDHPSNAASADLIYSEQQTITVSNGQFSVLIGQGSATAGTQFSFGEAAVGPPTISVSTASVFGNSSRYLGVSVSADATSAPTSEISPRQQVVSSAYAFRAKYAESLGTNGGSAITAVDTGNVGVGTTNPPALFTVSGANVGLTSSSPQMLITASSSTTNGLNEQLRVGVDSGTGNSFLQAYNTTGTGTAQSLLLNPNGGNVGIGNSTPFYPLSFSSTLGDKISLYGGSVFCMGFGVQSNLMQIHTDLAGSDIAFGYGLSGSFSENMRIKGSGMLLLGTTTALSKPGASSGDKLEISGGNLYVDGSYTSTIGQTYNATGTFHTVNQKLQVGAYNLNGTQQYGWIASSSDNGTSYPIVLNSGGGHVTIDSTPPTTGQTQSLVVNGGILARGGAPGGAGASNNGYAFAGNSGDNDSGMYSDADGMLEFYSNSAEIMRINGVNVGIGTTSPIQGKLVVSGNTTDSNLPGYGYLNSGGASTTGGGKTSQYSIWASDRIGANEFNAFSDERIKTIKGLSNGAEDLQTLLKIGVTDYTYRDTIAKGSKPQKKVIAQQVEKFYPQAVSTSTEVVPDIYRKASIKDGWVALDTDLKKDERVRFISEKEDKILPVLEVDAKEHKFRVEFKPVGEDIFVFGREVNDFRSVDYNALSMLNVSATQQIKKEKDAEVKSLKEENAALQAKVAAQAAQMAALEAAGKTRDARLAAIEKLLESGTKPAVRTASLK